MPSRPLRRIPAATIAAAGGLLLATALAMAEDKPATPTGGGAAGVPAPTPTATPNPAPLVKEPAAAVGRPDFSGHWQLDPKASDDPARMGQGGGPGGGPGGGMGRGGGPGGGRRGGLGGGPTVDPNRGTMPGEGFDGSENAAKERAEELGRQAAREFGQMEIFHAGDELDLTDGMQISRSLRIGGDPVEVFTPRGSVKAAAAWDGNTLVLTESDPKGEVRRTRQLILSHDRSTLTIKEIRRLPGKEGNHVMTMVYRREEAPARPGAGGIGR